MASGGVSGRPISQAEIQLYQRSYNNHSKRQESVKALVAPGQIILADLSVIGETTIHADALMFNLEQRTMQWQQVRGPMLFLPFL